MHSKQKEKQKNNNKRLHTRCMVSAAVLISPIRNKVSAHCIYNVANRFPTLFLYMTLSMYFTTSLSLLQAAKVTRQHINRAIQNHKSPKY